MSTERQVASFRRRVFAASMIVGPALLLIGELIHPQQKTDGAAQLLVLRAQPGRQYAAHLIFIFALVFFVPVLLGLVQLIDVRHARWGNIGFGLAVFGYFGLAAFAGAELVTWQVGLAAGSDAAGMAALLDRVNTSPGFVPLILLSVAFALGFAVLATGLRLARSVTWWEALLVGVGPLVTLLAEFSGAPKAAVGIPAAAILVGLGSIGIRLFNADDVTPVDAGRAVRVSR